MKRRLLSGLLAILMALSVLPVMGLAVSAAEVEVTATRTASQKIQIEVYNPNTNDIHIYYATGSSEPDVYYNDGKYYKNKSSLFDFYSNEFDYKAVDTNETFDITVSSTSATNFYYFITDTTPDDPNPEFESIPVPAYTTTTPAPTVNSISAIYNGNKLNISYKLSKSASFYYCLSTSTNAPLDTAYTKSSSTSATYTVKDVAYSNQTYLWYYAKDSAGKESARAYCSIVEQLLFKKAPTVAYENSSDTVVVEYQLNRAARIYYCKTTSSSKPSKTAFTNSFSAGDALENMRLSGYDGKKMYMHFYAEDSNGILTDIVTATVDAYTQTIIPSISDIRIASRTATSAKITFTSDAVGIISFKAATSEPEDGTGFIDQQVKIGTNTITVSVAEDETTLYYRLYSNIDEDRIFNPSKLEELSIYEYDSDDKTAPVITVNTDTERKSATKATFVYQSDKAGYIYYTASTTSLSSSAYASVTNYKSMTKQEGSNYTTIDVTVTADTKYICYYAEDYYGNKSPVGSYEIGVFRVDDKIAPEITDLSPSRTSQSQATISFKSDEAATMYYALHATTTISDKSKLTNSVGVKTGTNTVQISLTNSSSHVISFYVKDPSANETSITSIIIPAYTGGGTSTAGYAPTINGVARSTDNDVYVKADTGVTITVSASAHKDYNGGSKILEYSFDGGITWSVTNRKTYNENTIILLNTIQVRHTSDSAVQKYSIPLEIKNIDKLEPTATVATTPSSIGATAAKVASVKVTVTAKDQTSSSSAQSGLNDKAYSFDGGKTWQTENVKEYTADINIAAETICVRDAVGNTYKYASAINIENIDNTVPKVNIAKVTRSTVKTGNIELTSDEEGSFYYYTIYTEDDKLDLKKITDEERDSKIKSTFTLKEGTNTYQIPLTSEGEALVYYFVKDKAGNISSVSVVSMPKFTEEDKTAPVIEKVTLSSTSPTNEPVKVTIEAKDETALDNSAYSFDNGVSWQADAFKEYKENTAINAEHIQVKDAGGNITKWKEKIEIKNIDTAAPTITSVTPAVSGKNIVVAVTAGDNVALATSAYSFDGGESWQTGSTKSYSVAQDIAANTIQVRDTAGNIAKYQQRITKETLENLFKNAWQNPFTDVKTSDWFYEYVEFVVKNGLFKGTSDTIFAPSEEMTRAMFVTVLGRLDGVETSRYTTSSFKDVPTGEWYTPYIKWADEKGIVTGYGDGIFGLNDNITREQMCLMIKRYLDYKSINTGFTAKNINFSDASKISNWAKEAVSICEQAGIVIGENNIFNPFGDATRAEVATIFTRICNKYFV